MKRINGSECSAITLNSMRRSSAEAMSLLALSLLATLASTSVSQAYPGAKAADYHETILLRSACEEGTDAQHTTIYLYEQAGVTTKRGWCPPGSRAQVHQYTVAVKNLAQAEKEGYDAVSTDVPFKNKSFRMEYRIRAMNGSGLAITNEIVDDARYSLLTAQIATIADDQPVSMTINHLSRQIEDFHANLESKNRVEIKLVGTCKEMPSGVVRAYSRAGAPPIATFCPPAYQLTFEENDDKVDVTKYYNRTEPGKDFSGPTYRLVTNTLQILSRFGNPFFSQKISRKRKKEILLILTTATPESPVSVIVDSQAKVILDIKPSASPYAL